MRIAFALPLLLLGACSVENDPGNDQVTVAYNQDVAENAASDIGNTAGQVASDVGNTAERAGDAIQNEVGDVDVDVDVDRKPADNDGNAVTNSN